MCDKRWKNGSQVWPWDKHGMSLANDLKEIPGLEDSAETVLAAAKAEIDKRSAGGANESESNHQVEEEAMKETSSKSEETD